MHSSPCPDLNEDSDFDCMKQCEIDTNTASKTITTTVFTLPATAVAKYCVEHVCLSVCLCVCLSDRQNISETTRAIFTGFSVHIAYGRG